MNSDERKKEIDLTDFACRLLQTRGAILEPSEDSIEALLPPELAGFLETSELISLVPDKAQEKKAGKKITIKYNFKASFWKNSLHLPVPGLLCST